MKKIFNRLLLILLVSTAFFSSCDLEEKPMSVLTPVGFYETQKGIETLLSGIYNTVCGLENPSNNLHRLNIFGSDTEFAGEGADGDGLGWYYLNAENGTMTSVWNDFYALVNYCNYAVKYAPLVEDVSEAEKKNIEAQARFFRAYAYFHLTMQFGDVHFSLEASEGAATESNRTPVATIWDEGIYPDLRFAAANLTSKIELGHLNVWAGKFMLGYALLTDSRGTTAHWNEAAGLYKDIIDNGGFQLMGPANVFDQANDDANKEFIFAFRYVKPSEYSGGYTPNQSHMYYLGAYHQYGGILTRYDGMQFYGKAWCRYRIATWLIDTYDETIDSRYEAFFRDTWLCNFRDAVLTETVNGVEIKRVDTVKKLFTLNGEPDSVYIRANFGDTVLHTPKRAWTKAQIDAHPKIYVLNPDNSPAIIPSHPDDNLYLYANRSVYNSMKKFDDRKKSGGDNDSNGSRPDVIFRLADAYLLASEANLRAGNSGEALKYFNAIRRNAAYPGKESAMEITTAELDIDMLLDERGRELCGEGYRWTDLKRLGKLPERAAMNYHVQTKGFNNVPGSAWNDKYLLRPIPQAHIDRTTNDYPQNPGW
jgi:hypothetical protein